MRVSNYGLGRMKADIELVEDLKAGHAIAFSQLVERHQRALLGLCLRFVKDRGLAEDVVQDAFVKAYQKIHSFEGKSSFKNWLFQIAANTAKNKLRSMKRVSVRMDKVEVVVSSEVQQDLEYKDLKEMIQNHIDCLPEKQRTALVLRVFEDLSFKEIAKIMDCPYDTAKANYRHALLKLKDKFIENETLKNWEFKNKEISIRKIYTEADQ